MKFFDRLYYYKKLVPSKLNATFIISTGRTGTKFFETFFRQVDTGIYSVHEPYPDLFQEGINKVRYGYSSDDIKKNIFLIRSAYLKEISRERPRIYVESNPFLPPVLDEIYEVFPKAKFIYISRDPKSYLNSALNKSPGDDGVSFFYAENDTRKRITAKDIKDKYEKRWEEFSREEKILWYWNYCNLSIIDFFERKRPDKLHLKFEDIFSKDIDTKKDSIERILDFMNLNNTSEKIIEDISFQKKNFTRENIFDTKEFISDKRSVFNELTKEAMMKIDAL